MIKNFFVKRKIVKNKEKGLFNLLNYLENEEHKNHKEKTEKIIPVHRESSNYYLNVLNRVKKREFTTKKAGKGGRDIQSYRYSYCFSFPKGVNPTQEEYKKIIEILLKDFSSVLNVEKEELLNNSFINIHENENKHINLITHKIFNNEVIDLSKNKYLITLKKSFNNRCLNVLNLDKNSYKPKNPKTRQNNSIYTHKLKQLLKEELKEDYKLDDKILKRFINYLNRLQTHIENKKTAEIEKTKKYLNTIINKQENTQIKNIMIKQVEEYSSPQN
jgi:hypothetical protein